VPRTTEIFIMEWSVQAAVHTVIYRVLNERQILLTPHDSVHAAQFLTSQTLNRHSVHTMYDLKLSRKVCKLCQLSANQQLVAPHHTEPHDGSPICWFSTNYCCSCTGYCGSFLGVQWLAHGVHHPPPPSAHVQNEYSSTSSFPLCLHGMLQREFYLNTVRKAIFPLQNEGKTFANRQNILVPKFTTVPTTATKLNHARDVFSRVPLWVSGDSPQTTSIAPCSNYTNVHPVPLTAPYLGLFTSGQPITDYTDNTHSWFHLFGILLWYFNPWNWDHYIPLKPINHQHSATFQKEWKPQRSSYLHWLNIK